MFFSLKTYYLLFLTEVKKNDILTRIFLFFVDGRLTYHVISVPVHHYGSLQPTIPAILAEGESKAIRRKSVRYFDYNSQF